MIRRKRAAGLARASALAALVVLTVLIPLTPTPSAHAQAPGAPVLDCPDNRLANPGFEAGFSARGQLAELVGNGWTPWYARLPGVGGLNHPPDFSPARRGADGPAAVHAGLWSQSMATEDATHTGGLWQQVPVPPGSQVLAWVWAYAWASGGDDPARSEPPGTYALRLGLDPAGGTDPEAAGIVWTQPITVTDTWLPLSLEAPVAGPLATLYLRGQPRSILAHNQSRWDSACLRVLGVAGEPTLPPTAPARPTRVPPTLAPDQPTPTPNAATVEAIMLDLARATERAVALQIKAATRAAALGGAAAVPSSGGGSQVILGMPTEEGSNASGDAPFGSGAGALSGGLSDDRPPPPVPIRVQLADHAGLIALTAAAFAGGLLLGFGRERSK